MSKLCGGSVFAQASVSQRDVPFHQRRCEVVGSFDLILGGTPWVVTVLKVFVLDTSLANQYFTGSVHLTRNTQGHIKSITIDKKTYDFELAGHGLVENVVVQDTRKVE